MYFRCPACKRILKGIHNMTLHLTGHSKFSLKHQNILESYILVKEGTVKLKSKSGNSASQPLMQLIDKKCKLAD